MPPKGGFSVFANPLKYFEPFKAWTDISSEFPHPD